MKKFLKLFSLLCLFFTIFMTNCFAVQDCRTVKNKKLIDTIKHQFDYAALNTAYGKDWKVNFERITLLVNIKNTEENIVVIPILNKSLTRVIGETFMTVKTQGMETADDVLNFFTCFSKDDLEFKLSNFNLRPFDSRFPRYFCIESLVDFFKPYVNLKQNDRIFYVTQSDSLNNSVYITVESHKDGIAAQSNFSLQSPHKLRPVNLDIPVKNGIIDWLKNFFNSSSKNSIIRNGNHYDKLD